MNWIGLLAIMVASWCGIRIGRAIDKKDKEEIIFNSFLMFIEWLFVFFSWGIP